MVDSTDKKKEAKKKLNDVFYIIFKSKDLNDVFYIIFKTII